MATYNFPDITPTNQTFELVTNTRQFQSPTSGAIQTLSRKGSFWKTRMTFSNLSGSDRAELQAFIAKMDGQVHRMRLEDYGRVRNGAATSPQTVLVDGAGQTGSSITLDGATASVTNFFKAGDYLSFNNELHMVTDDASSDASGDLTVSIAPPIRKPTNDNDDVRLFSPFGVFMMTNTPRWNTESKYISSITIEAVEDVLA
jgi:hypothetical protein